MNLKNYAYIYIRINFIKFWNLGCFRCRKKKKVITNYEIEILFPIMDQMEYEKVIFKPTFKIKLISLGNKNS